MAVSDVLTRANVRNWVARLSALRSWWFAALAAGAALRLFCALFVSNTLDMRFYAVVASDGQLHKPLYADGVFSYPPLWGYVLHAIGKIALLLHIQPFIRAYEMLPFTVPGLNSSDLTTPAMSLLVKLPIIALDAIMLVLIVDIARRLGASERAARYAALGWWLNPVVIFCSAVNASWDAVVPLVLLATVLLAYTGRWFSSGALVSLGVMAKLTPIYAGFIALAMALRRDEKMTQLQRVLWLIAGGLACAALLLVPVVWWHEWGAMRAAVFTRAGTFVIGGPNLFSFTALLPFHGVRDALESARSLLSLMTSGSTLIAILLACLVLVRIRVATFVDYLYALIGLVSVVLIFTPYTQPTYAIWVLPAALLLAASGRRYWAGYALCLTLAATVFVGTIRSPFDLITPLCYFAHACNPVSAGQHALDYRFWTFPFAENFQIGIDALVGQVMCFMYIAGLVNVIGYFRKRVTEVLPEAASQNAAVSSTPLAFGCGALALTMLAVMVPAPAAPLLSISQNRRSAVIASAGFSGTIHATRAEGVPAISTLYVYFDNRYATGRGVSPTFVAGFGMHLTSDVQSRSLPVKVLPIDAAGLPAVLNGAARGIALTVMGGILPSTVRSKGSDLLQKWIARGGLVFWAGEPFDVLYSQSAIGKHPAAISPPDYSKWRAWYAVGAIFPPTVDPYTPPVMHGTTQSVYWHLARLTFGKTTFACNTGPLLKMGGHPIGFVDSHVNSSVSTIPYGRGRVVFFGDGFDDEILAADSVAQILATDVWYRPDRVREYDGRLSPDKLPMTIPNLPRGAHVFAYGNAMPDGSPFTNIVIK